MAHFAFAAAYLDPESNNIIKSFGFQKEDFHVTTVFDKSGVIVDAPTIPFEKQTARIKAIVEWDVGSEVFLIAELEQCDWSLKINSYLKSHGAVEDLPHKAHVTLMKGGAKGLSKNYQNMVGIELSFNRHVVKRKEYKI